MKRRKVYYLFLILLISLTIAELLLRSIIPFEIAFQTWFSPGAQRPDERFGFVFSQNYDGFMRHRDGVLNVPLQLDQYGFRKPFELNNTRQRNSQNIVFMGGASLIFSYGLPDQETIPAEVVKSSCVPLKSYTTSWPGVSLYRNFHIYKEMLEPDINPDFVVLSVYQNDLYDFESIPNDFDDKPEPASVTWLYHNDKPVIVYPSGFLAERLGKLYYQSYILSKLVSLIDFTINQIHSFINDMIFTSDTSTNDSENHFQRNQNFRAFISYLQNYFQNRDIPISVVFMPSMESPQTDLFSELREAVPKEINAIDLHQKLRDNLDDKQFIASGHYNQQQASLMGDKIADQICPLLKQHTKSNE